METTHGELTAWDIDREWCGLCPDCGAEPGAAHTDGCDVARCPKCKGQRLSCDCVAPYPESVWSGVWPGSLEAASNEMFSRFVGADGQPTGGTGGRWQKCAPEDPGAGPDLNEWAFRRYPGGIKTEYAEWLATRIRQHYRGQ